MPRFAGPVVLSLLAAALCLGYDFTALQPQGYASDFTSQKVIDQASRQELASYCGALERSTGAQLALVAIDTLENEPIEDVANAIYRKWGVGSKKNNEGALILLVVRDRRMRLEVGYGLEPILPDGFDGDVLRAMRPSLRAGKYGEALLDAAHTLGDRIAQAKGVSISSGGAYRARRVEPRTQIPWGAIIMGIVVLLFLFSVGRRGGGTRGGGGEGVGGFLTGFLLSTLLGGGGRGSWGGGTSSGGFGGYDSGGGFGGFGGGDSGGGGASSDW